MSTHAESSKFYEPIVPSDQIQYREYKLLLKPDRFPDEKSFHKFWKLAHHAAKSIGIKLSKIGRGAQGASARSGLLRHAALQALQSRLHPEETHLLSSWRARRAARAGDQISASGQEGGAGGRSAAAAAVRVHAEVQGGDPPAQGRHARECGWCIRTTASSTRPTSY